MALHPIVAQVRPSEEQAPAIVARGRDVAVTAGAGAGKTRTLVARYLSLLADGLGLRSIVAITFTRKAAREMRNRIRDEMRRYLERTDLEANERARWQGLYRQLDAARIGTIHSLCTDILRAHPAEARLDPRFEVLAEGHANILLSRAIDEALAWAADDARAVELFPLLGEGGLRNTLEDLLKARLAAHDVFSRLPDDVIGHWRQSLAVRQEQVLDSLCSSPEWGEAVATLKENEADDPGDLMEIQRCAALASIPAQGASLDASLETLAGLQEIRLSGGRVGAWSGGKAQLQDVKDALRSLRVMWKPASKVLGLEITELDEALARALPALRSVFDYACARYIQYKQERSALDFEDLEQGALVLLRDDAGVRQRWQSGVMAILVDEFQDTNSRQRDLIALLNGDGGKLFFVGDAKQSIYRFRGADVTVFRQEREKVETQGGNHFSLGTSYRAHEDLIAELNALLRPVLGEQTDPHRPWVESFSSLLPHRELAGEGIEPPFIELHLTVGSKKDGALYRAADAVAARILELVVPGTQVMGETGFRQIQFGDVAILCRATRSFEPYEDALERAGIPFLTVAGRGFYDRPEIRDLLNALRALSDPTDDLALAGLLRSPAFALSDAALYHLCRERDARHGTHSLWTTLLDRPSKLAADDEARAARAVDILLHLHAQVGRVGVADLLKGLVDAVDYRAVLLEAGQERGTRNVAKLLSDAHASGIVGVGEFVEYVDGLRDIGTREGEARSPDEGAVQIMTVHAAKGLEFPVVVLGDAAGGGGGYKSLLLDPELGPLLPQKDEQDQRATIYSLGEEQEKDMEQAEADRLFYVAATRAREKLLISGHIGLKADRAPGKMGGWLGEIAASLGLYDKRFEDYDAQGSRVQQYELGLGDGAPAIACLVYEPAAISLVAPSQSPPSTRRLGTFPPSLLAAIAAGEELADDRVAQRGAPQRVWRVVPATERTQAPAWVIGSLVHEALAAWRFPGQGFEGWAAARVREYGITDAQRLDDAITRSGRLLTRFQRHSLFAEMERAERRLHEVPYAIAVDGCVERGIIDALYLGPDGWIVVEFKTDRVDGARDLAQLMAETGYETQARRYAAAVERLVGQRPRTLLCLLNYGSAVHLHAVE